MSGDGKPQPQSAGEDDWLKEPSTTCIENEHPDRMQDFATDEEDAGTTTSPSAPAPWQAHVVRSLTWRPPHI